MSQLIRGTTEECLRHFSAQLGRDFSRRNKICELLDIHKETGHNWFGELRVPKGETLICLQCLLETLGYTLEEHSDIPKHLRGCVELVGFRVVSAQGMAERFEVNIGTVLRFLTSRSGYSKKIKDKMFALIGTEESSLAKAKQTWKKALGIKTISDKPSPEVAEEKQPVRTDHEQIINSLAHLMLAILPLAEQVRGNEFSASERQELRRRVQTQHNHSNAVFELYRTFGDLCSEKARNGSN